MFSCCYFKYEPCTFVNGVFILDKQIVVVVYPHHFLVSSFCWIVEGVGNASLKFVFVQEDHCDSFVLQVHCCSLVCLQDPVLHGIGFRRSLNSCFRGGLPGDHCNDVITIYQGNAFL